MERKPLVVAQITDLHLLVDRQARMFGINTYDSLNDVLTLLAKQPHQPDLILLTGDLAQDVNEVVYQTIIELFRPWHCPIYWIPGNHDNPALMTLALAHSHFSSDPVFILGGWKFILLSTHLTGHANGFLAASELQLLKENLTGEHPITIVTHHPPIPSGTNWLDKKVALDNAEELLNLIEGVPNVKLVLSGHIHQDLSVTYANVRFLTCPSSCFQFSPHSENFGLEDIAPGYRELRLFPDGQFQTEVKRVPDYTGKIDLKLAGYTD